MIIVPQTEEQRAASEKLRHLVADAQAHFKKLSPIDQAIHRLEQRRSAVRGLTPMDSPLSREDVNTILDKQPEYVVLAAYRAAEARAARLQADVEKLKKLITPYVWNYAGKNDCVDNHGNPYQSQHSADLERDILAALADTAPDASDGRAD